MLRLDRPRLLEIGKRIKQAVFQVLTANMQVAWNLKNQVCTKLGCKYSTMYMDSQIITKTKKKITHTKNIISISLLYDVTYLPSKVTFAALIV